MTDLIEIPDIEEHDPAAVMAAMVADARDDLLFYTQCCNAGYIVSGLHEFLAAKLEAVARGTCKRLIVTCPPRHGKSQLISIEFTTWLLGRAPATKIVLGSYAQDLALAHSKSARARMQSEEYKEIFPTRIADGEGAANEWKTAEGGMYKAVGVGGGLTGRGADVLLIDDPVKDFKEAHSPTIRENVWQWFWSVAYTRLHPGAAVVILMTRWHDDDLVGRMLKPERMREMELTDAESQWEVVNIPAISDSADDPMRRPIGAALFPERYPIDKLQSIKANVGSYVWSALYTGRPTVRGGNYIKVGMMVIVDAAPEGLRWVRYWDLAASTEKSSDFTASIAGALGADGVLYLRHGINVKQEWPEARKLIKLTADVERISIGIEAVAGFKTAYRNLIEVMRSDLMCREYNIDRDKLTRALEWIAMVENGKVALVHGTWVMDFIIQAEAFPSGKHDDMIDAVSGVWAMLKSVFLPKQPASVMNGRFAQAMADRKRRSLIG